MKISVMTYAFGRAFGRKEMDVAAFLQMCAACGVEGVELGGVHLHGTPDGEIRRMVDDLGLAWPVYIGSVDFVVDDRTRFLRAVDAAKAEIERARRLEVPIVMLTTGSPKPEIEDARGRALIAEGLRLASEFGARIGVRVSTENHGGHAQFRGRLEHIRAFLEAAPHLWFTLDDGNFLLAGDDPRKALAEFSDRLIHVHIKDFKAIPAGPGTRFPVPGRPRWAYAGVSLGEGDVDTAKTVRALSRHGYDGFLSIEGNENYRDASSLAADVRYVRSLLAGLS